MSISIQTNVSSLLAEQALNQNTSLEGQAIEQLSSGYRINSSGDDAAGLAVANQYRSTIAELQQGVLNASNGTSILQIVDGGLNNISTILDRLQTLATESASATFAGNRNTLNQEFQSLVQEIGQEIEDMALALDPGLQLPIVLLGSIGLRMADRLPPALRARLVEPSGDAVDGAHRLVRQQMKEAVA